MARAGPDGSYALGGKRLPVSTALPGRAMWIGSEINTWYPGYTGSIHGDFFGGGYSGGVLAARFLEGKKEQC